MPEPIGDVEQELTLLSRHHLRSTSRAPERELDQSGYALLGRLEHGDMTLKQLALAFRLDQSTVNRQINYLLRAGLVKRDVNPAGGAAHVIRATPTGLAALRRDRDVARQQVAHVLTDWSDTDIAALAALLLKFNQSIEQLEGQPWPRSS